MIRVAVVCRSPDQNRAERVKETWMIFPYKMFQRPSRKFVSGLNGKRNLTWDIIHFVKKEVVFTVKILTEQDI